MPEAALVKSAPRGVPSPLAGSEVAELPNSASESSVSAEAGSASSEQANSAEDTWYRVRFISRDIVGWMFKDQRGSHTELAPIEKFLIDLSPLSILSIFE